MTEEEKIDKIMSLLNGMADGNLKIAKALEKNYEYTETLEREVKKLKLRVNTVEKQLEMTDLDAVKGNYN